MDGEEKIYAYVFVKGAIQGFLNSLLGLAEGEETAIRYAAVLTGDTHAIAAVEVNNLGELEAVIHHEVFRITPTLTTSTAIGLCRPAPIGCNMPRIQLCEHPVEAFIRIWVQRGRAEDVVADLLAIDGIDEAGVVAGDFDVLTVICVPTLDEVIARLLDEVHRIPSIVRTSTSFVLRSARRVEPEQA
jgi:DNA-binding Lrp family transcriptional regulator